MERILLVEDDRNLSFITKRMLESRGFDVTAALSLAEAREKLQRNRFDLILLDMMLPDGEGTELCAEIRENSVCPIIFVSCLSDNLTKISALQMGGDDYVTKPVNYEELVARVQVNIRRAKLYNLKTDINELSFRGLVVNKQKHEVWLTDEDGSPAVLADLSPIEYGLLICLIDHEGELMLYQTLYNHVWQSDDFGDVRTVMVHVSNLRKKLGDAGSLIHTIRSAGYIFKQ